LDDKGKSIVARRPRIFLLAVSAIYAASAAGSGVLDRFRSRAAERRKKEEKKGRGEKEEKRSHARPYRGRSRYKYVYAQSKYRE